ncbi:hypothetical protein FRC0290_01938 [Corynebacterium diphtheriae]|nr:hypothetical protein FRC0290_01938 [Corynebacterium diphtheriae]CAB1024567.1 hypothetical protein FRC0534_02101 [Corynebacterium diphtheriae]
MTPGPGQVPIELFEYVTVFGGITRYLVSIPDNGDSRWSRYGLLAL